jgi:CRISPR-associated endonuclease Cas1
LSGNPLIANKRPSQRRAQSLAHRSGIALPIAKVLIRQKLIGQQEVLLKYFPASNAMRALANAEIQLVKSRSSDEIRLWEEQAAKSYWTAWREFFVQFPRADLPRVPEHWRIFGNRVSPLTSSPRLAVNPPNAMLNYLYAVLESESRLALAALGLDPGIGVLHNDLRTRDSLACDLMEPNCTFNLDDNVRKTTDQSSCHSADTKSEESG